MHATLQKLGLTKADATRVMKRWGEFGAADRIRENPYAMLQLRVSLQTADAVARKLKIADDDPRRVWAIAHEIMQKDLLDGNCYMVMHTLASETARQAGIPQPKVEAVLCDHKALVVDGKRVMPIGLYEAEGWIAKRVHALLEQHPFVENTYELDDRAGIELDEQQLRACDLILSAGVGVITGPPGSGKTSVVNEALRQFAGSVSLCAPTGKAAIRMQEVSQRSACTIHRLLAWSRGCFTNDENSPLFDDLVIVDESSMLDVNLAAALSRAVDPDRTRIIFVGDANQLPPVGPGAFFRDLIASGVVPVVKLATNHRAAEHSWVYRNAPRILDGKGVELEDCADFEWHELERDQAWYIKDAVRDLLLKLRQEGVPADEIQVIAPMKVREGGTQQLNKELQAAFNPPDRNKKDFTVGFGEYAITIREGDRVMQTKNNYELSVFNGEVGEVETVTTHAGIKIRFDKQYRMYTNPEHRNDLMLAYAGTVHKMQGSEFKDIIFVCHSAHKWMLTRQLLYTAVTRARRRVFLVGDKEGVQTALRTMHDAKRRTLLQERLKGAA